MEKKSDILNELQSISPLIASVKKVNVFSVPDGYFNSICNTVMLSINEGFSNGNIANFPKGTDIPAGYFENLSGSILERIKKQEAGELPTIFSTIKKDQPFQVPGNYFETLADSILNKIKTTSTDIIEERENLPAVLRDLKTVQPFQVPENYFPDLPANILNKVKQCSNAKIVSMPKRFIILRYAAAAVITGALALGIYKYSNQQPVNNTNPVASVVLDQSIEKGKAMDDQKFNETLNNLSADEIENYLQKNNNEADVAVLSSNMEENSLPNEEDYLTDDKTLDNFLKEIDTKTN
jgi:hypothetical protein